MKYQFDHDYHIHSKISLCSDDPAQTTARILQYAKDNGLKKIVVTDHYWDESLPCSLDWYRVQGFDRINKSLPLPSAEGIEFLFGAETEFNMNLEVGVSKEMFDAFDFVVIPFTHLHIGGFVIREEDKNIPERMAELWFTRLEKLLSMDLPFHKIGIAHPVCEMIGNKKLGTYLEPMKLINKRPEEMARLFKKAAALGVGIEINQYDIDLPDEDLEYILPMYRIAKDAGCKFYLGSDAHHPDHFERSKIAFLHFIDLLGLEETDKFHF